MKAYTDIKQSEKLANILPLESADMHYSKDFDGSWFVDLAEYTSVKIPKYVVNIEEHLLPCWSLAALLDFLARYTKSLYWFDDTWHCEYIDDDGVGILGTNADNVLDACYEMIVKLHELNIL